MPDGTFHNQLDDAASLMALALSRLEPGPRLDIMRAQLASLTDDAERYAAEPSQSPQRLGRD